jgi:acetyl esterase/lipase
MLDDRNVNADPMIEDVASWKSGDNRTGWDAILGSNRGKSDVKPSAAPARMIDATGLPSTFIDVGELDIFRDEDIDYAKKLVQAGISCELHVYPGCIHGFELMAPQANVSQRALQNRYQAIRTIQPVGTKTKL